MKTFSLALFAMLVVTSLQTQAGDSKRDGFLKKSGDATLVLLKSEGTTNCYLLVGETGKVPAAFAIDTFSINGTALKTQVDKAGDETSNHNIENEFTSGVDVSGEAYEIKTKKLTSLTFCTDLAGVAAQVPNLISISLGGKTGTIQTPRLSR